MSDLAYLFVCAKKKAGCDCRNLLCDERRSEAFNRV
jgi:hypothetical protein